LQSRFEAAKTAKASQCKELEGQIKEVKGAVKKLEEVVIASILMALEEIHA
jgi:hypothetical protein